MTLPNLTVAQAVYSRLTTALNTSVYAAGRADNADAPYVVVEFPRSQGEETLDGVAKDDVRLSIRVHTAGKAGQADFQSAMDIANEIHSALKEELVVDGVEPHVPRPNVTPLEYDIGPDEATDVNLRYDFSDLN